MSALEVAPPDSEHLVDHALHYAARGWPVFPCSQVNKRPFTEHGFKDATTNEAVIRRWWNQWPAAMIGVPTGPATGIWALDPDKPKTTDHADGYAAWANLARDRGGVPHTHTHETPGGGLHLLFAWDPDRPVTTSSGRLPAGIDVRGRGGYIIVPPSFTLDGREYRVAESLDWFIFATAPDWLYELILPAPKQEPKPVTLDATAKVTPLARGGFFQDVNGEALRNIAAWVSAIFPSARYQEGTGAWRISSSVLGRDLEEDLSIHPDGIQDFGEERGRTPIDLVMRWGGVGDPRVAALWLCEKIGIVPETLGYRGDGRRSDRPSEPITAAMVEQWRKDDKEKFQRDADNFKARAEAEKASAPPPKPIVEAQPFRYREPSTMPRRQWIYGKHYVRRFLSTTVAPGGVGKSSLVIVEALAMVTGKALLGVIPPEPVRVWIWNGEDPLEETERRVIAAMMKFGIKPEEVEGRLFLGSGREMEIVLATAERNGPVIAAPVSEAMKATILANKIDVVIIDPFVSSHRVSENDNVAIDAVAKEWGRIAEATNCAIELVHHARKTGGNEVTVEDGRGAVALLSAARSGRVLNGMKKDEAERAGVEQHRAFFRVDNGKLNMAPPPPDRSSWFQLKSVALGNGSGGMIDDGDHVAVVTTWEWPDPIADLKLADTEAVQRKVRSGRWRENHQCADWVGFAVAEVMDLDAEAPADRTRIKGLIKAWIASKALVVREGKDDKHMLRKFVEAGD